jgi:hypothetical protein
MLHSPHFARRLVLAAGLLLSTGALSGCARQSAVTLIQPHAPRSQQALRLASRWAFSDGREGRRHSLLAFPLPGAEDGPRSFLI